MTLFEEAHLHYVVNDIVDLVKEGKIGDVLSFIAFTHPDIYDSLLSVIDEIEENG